MSLDLESYILGKKSGGGGGSNFQTKSVEITENGTTNITPDTGYDALRNVNVTVSGILDTSDADAVASDMAMSKTAYVNGNKITGNVPVGSPSVSTNYSSNNVDIYLNDLQVDTQQGNTNQMFKTGDKISVYAPLSDVAPVIGAIAGKIKKDEVICGVTGTYEGGGDDWSDIGYSSTPEIVVDDHNFSKQIYDAWDSSRTSASYYFDNATGQKMVICPLMDTSNITGSVQNMFPSLANLREVPRLVMTPNNCSRMFYNCTKLEKVDTSGIDTTNCTNMYGIFNNCSALKNISINFKTDNLTSVSNMFDGCNSLEAISFGSNFKIENITSTYRMFYNCTKLTSLDLSNFDFAPTNMNEMFYSCQKLTTINFGSNFDLSQLTSSSNTFSDCRVLDDNTLDKILELYIDATNISTKTLKYIGFTSNYYPLSRLETLSNWQDFLDAGWTTGY